MTNIITNRRSHDNNQEDGDVTQGIESVMKAGDYVAWKYANGIAQGEVVSVHFEPIIVMTKGSRIKRNGSPENPALVIEHKSGNDVLKLASEVQKMAKK